MENEQTAKMCENSQEGKQGCIFIKTSSSVWERSMNNVTERQFQETDISHGYVVVILDHVGGNEALIWGWEKNLSENWALYIDGLLATERVRQTLAVHFMPNLHLLQVYQSWKLIGEGGKPFLSDDSCIGSLKVRQFFAGRIIYFINS